MQNNLTEDEISSLLKSLFDSKDLKIVIGKTERSVKATLYYKDRKISTAYRQCDRSSYEAVYNLSRNF